MRIYIETYGCTANLNNAEIISGLLIKAGHKIVKKENNADIIIINSCIVKEPTEKKIIRRLEDLKKENKKIILSGCMPETHSFLDFSMVGPRRLKDIVECVNETGKDNIVKFIGKEDENKSVYPKTRKNDIIEIVQILDGCLGNCSYCLTRYAKGNLYSYPSENIIRQVECAIKNGCKEIWITSQDNGCYGLDRKDELKLPDLLREILKKEGKFFVRLGMINPNFALVYLDDLINIFKNDKMFKFLHIPLQSGSDNVLKHMKRKYCKEDFVKIVNKLRKEIPDITIATDIIVGYPSETEKYFDETKKLIQNIQPEILNISRYWPMKSTESSFLKQLDVHEVMRRSKIIHELFSNYSLENNKKWIGFKGIAIVDEGKKGNWTAHNIDYKTIVIKSDKNLFEHWLNIEVIGSGLNYLKAVAKDL